MRIILAIFASTLLSACNTTKPRDTSTRILDEVRIASEQRQAEFEKKKQESDPLRDAGIAAYGKFVACSRQHADALLNSSEGARDVALAAIGSCNEHYRAGQQLYVAGHKTIYGSEMEAINLYEKQHARLVDDLTGYVVNARANRQKALSSPEPPRPKKKETEI